MDQQKVHEHRRQGKCRLRGLYGAVSGVQAPAYPFPSCISPCLLGSLQILVILLLRPSINITHCGFCLLALFDLPVRLEPHVPELCMNPN